jgi:hypothetical protein
MEGGYYMGKDVKVVLVFTLLLSCTVCDEWGNKIGSSGSADKEKPMRIWRGP